MHLFFRKPQRNSILKLIEQYRSAPSTFGDSGKTRHWSSEQFRIQLDSNRSGESLVLMRRVELGSGGHDYRCAEGAIRDGICFDLSWVDIIVDGPLKPGVTFCVMARAFGIWSANFCRVSYVDRVDQESEQMLSLVIETLPRHAAVGEERIAVYWNRDSEAVDFLIGSISRPRHWLARLMKHYLRRQQGKFAVDAAKRLRFHLKHECE